MLIHQECKGFIHIPKCGGISVSKTISEYYYTIDKQRQMLHRSWQGRLNADFARVDYTIVRRHSRIFSYNNIDFYDDYAHHPTEIRVVLQGVKQVFSKYEKICIFQPHRISRLKDLKKEFTYAFNDADTVILCPIYTAGEKIKLGFSYEDFAKKIIKNSDVKLYMVDNNNQLSKYLKQNMYGKKIVVAMGAGSISNWIKELPSLMQ